MIVVDSNVIAARRLTTVLTSKAERIERRDPVWIVPALWRYEFQNILATAIRARQISLTKALEVWEGAETALAENESEPSPARVLDLVARFGITAYDGQFIALAMELGVPCITEDRELRRKFRGVAFSLEDFLESSEQGRVSERRAPYRLQPGSRVRKPPPRSSNPN